MDTFVQAKGTALFSSLLITFASFIIPAMFAYLPPPLGEEPTGPIVFAWYYGILGSIAIFFGINYYFYKKLEKNK